MRRSILLVALVLAACNSPEPPISQQLPNFEEYDGFVDMYWDESKGRLLLKIEAFDEPFLYQSSLARGIGSNDLFLDRGQLGATRVVEFQRSGPESAADAEQSRLSRIRRQCGRKAGRRGVVRALRRLGL